MEREYEMRIQELLGELQQQATRAENETEMVSCRESVCNAVFRDMRESKEIWKKKKRKFGSLRKNS